MTVSPTPQFPPHPSRVSGRARLNEFLYAAPPETIAGSLLIVISLGTRRAKGGRSHKEGRVPSTNRPFIRVLDLAIEIHLLLGRLRRRRGGGGSRLRG
jgi:hypothetical protein